MLPRDHAWRNRSVAPALEVVGERERWTLLILRDAFMGVARLGRSVRREAAGEVPVR